MDGVRTRIGGVAIGAALLLAPLCSHAQSMEGWKITKTGMSLIATPANLGAGEVFTMTVEPPINLLGKDPKEWLAARAAEEAGTLGTVTDATPVAPLGEPGRGAWLLVRTVKLPTGGERLLGYFLAPRTDGTIMFARILSSPEPAIYKKYLPEVIRSFLSAAAKDKSPSTSSGERPVAKTTKRKPRNKSSSENYTKVGIGANRKDVAGIYLRLAPQMGFGGMIMMNYQPTVMFKDGTYYEDYDVPLPDFDRQAARVARPTAWGKWRKQGGMFQEYDSKDGWEKAEWLGPVPGGKPGEKLTGRYTSFTGGGDTAMGGGNAYGVSGGMVFSPDGRFTTDTSVGLTAESADMRTTASSRSGKEGTYVLDGYMLVMKFSDGRVERRAFVFMDTDGKRDGFYVDGTPYTKKK
ncbi:MAG: hypothetical protein H7Y38_03055 [Armatimonadetes bacterium]|nr:hypothetical protein [Armatimonadota bacterium]